MNTLRVEELESRDLLNGASLAPPTFDPIPYSVGPSHSRVAEPATPSEFGAERNATAYQMTPSGTGQAAGDFRGAIMMSYDPIVVRPIETIVVVEWIILPGQPAQRNSDTPSEAAEPPGTVTISTSNPKSPAAPEAVATVPATYGETPQSRSTPAAVVPTAIRANLQAPFVIVPPTNNPTVAAEAQGSIASPIAVRAVAFQPGNGARLANGGTLVQASSGAAEVTPAAEETESAKATQETPPPIGPGVLATLSTVDLTALSRGLEQFLSRIERAGEELIVEGDGLRPWLIAGAAAATACEIARRQLKRAAELAADGVPDALPDHLIVV